jgi:hypothetical protein
MIKIQTYNWAESFNRNFRTIVLFLGAFLLPVFYVYADGYTCDPSSGKICNPIKASSVQELIKSLLEGVIKIGLPVIALALIYSGFLFVQAQGKPSEIETAQKSFTYTIIGAAILLGAWALAQMIAETVLSL